MPKGRDILTAIVRDKLVALRNAHGLNDSAWARAARLRQQDVSRFVHAQMKYPPLDFLDALARVFNRTLADILAEEMPKSEMPEWQSRVLVALRAMDPSDRHAFEQLISRPTTGGTGPRRGRRANH